MTILPQATIDRTRIDMQLVGLAIRAAVATGILLGGFVLFEPAPYELYLAALIGLWLLFGLRFSRPIVPLAGLLLLFCAGGLIATLQMTALHQAPLYLAVTLFLSMTSIFFAAIIERRPYLLGTIFRASVLAGVLTALAGIAGYFALFPGAEMFTRHGRAAGVFEDPNVFGPFLVLPAIWLLYRILNGRPGELLHAGIPLLVLLAGLLLSFSRGAWGLFLLSAALLVLAGMLQNRSTRYRLRIVALAGAALALLVIFLLIALQIPEIADLFSDRARLVQDYDAARHGRFDRMASGFALALEHPFGIGPLQFGRIFGEDTHNIWLKALLDYSWLGFGAFLLLIVWTLAAGLRILLRNRPWQPFLLTAYVVLCGHIGLGIVIDLDHWRHFYLLLGIIWGCILLERRHRPQIAASPSSPPRVPLPREPL